MPPTAAVRAGAEASQPRKPQCSPRGRHGTVQLGHQTVSAAWLSKLEEVPAMKARRVTTSLIWGRTAGSWDQHSLHDRALMLQ